MLTPLRELVPIRRNITGNDLAFSAIRRLQDKKIDFDVYLPSIGKNLQREKVWTLQQKRQLIMSLFLERGIPHVSLMSLVDRSEGDKHTDDILQVIDGKQRLTTFMDFYQNEFTVILEGEEYYYADLPEDYQLRVRSYDIRAQVWYEDFDRPFTDEEKIKWFSLINFAGTPQDEEHMRSIGCEIYGL